MRLNSRVAALKPSSTLALNQKAKNLAASGKSIINLTTGEPDFATPARILRAAKSAIDRGETKYTAVGGIAELKAAVSDKIAREYNRTYPPKSVLISNGAKQSLFNLCFALLNPGDEAIVFAPYWVSYTEMVEVCGGRSVVIQTREEDQFVPNIDELERVMSDRVRLVFINSPSNPTGAVYPPETLERMAAVFRKSKNAIVVTDDIYGKLIFERQPFTSIGMFPDFPSENLVIVSGVSKSYSMTGWRIGYAVGPEPLISAMEAVQSQSTSNPSSISQWAAVEALSGDQSDVAEMCKWFEERRNSFWQKLVRISDISCVKPAGAFYAFPNISRYLSGKTVQGKTLNTDVDLTSYLLEDCGLAVVPGSAFGAPGFLRLSYSSPTKDLDEGILRFTKGLEGARA
jgi:aspartate aminotransferase